MKSTYNFIKYSGMLGLITFTMHSCEKLLEVETPENQIDKELIFEDVQTANAALAGLYSGIRDNSTFSGDQAGPVLGVYTDELDNYAVATPNGIIDIYRNQHIESNSIVYNFWSNNYKQVYSANSILEGIESSNALSQSDKNRIKGEALFLRSLLFFHLQQIYGDIAYPVTTNYQINQHINRTPAKEVLQRLESDLKESAGLLADNYTNSERIFANKKTVEMLLAKVLMEQERWLDAEMLFKGIVQNSQYVWETDLTKVFLKSGKHILWQLKPSQVGNPTSEANIYFFGNTAPTNYALSPNLYNSFETNDQRRQKWISSTVIGTNTWYKADKYKLRVNNTTEYSIVFRLGEVYLLLAECLAKQDRIQESIPWVNNVRTRAGLSALSSSITQNGLLDSILTENRKEFFAEMGKRFFDLKRAGKLNQLTAVKPNWKTFHQFWPVPQQELLLNPALNPQNSGY